MKALTRLAIIPALIILVGVACSFSAGDTSTSDTTDHPRIRLFHPPRKRWSMQGSHGGYIRQDSSSPTANLTPHLHLTTEPIELELLVAVWERERRQLPGGNGKMHVEINGKETYLYFTYDAYTYDNVYIETVVDNRGVNSQSVSLICADIPNQKAGTRQHPE